LHKCGSNIFFATQRFRDVLLRTPRPRGMVHHASIVADRADAREGRWCVAVRLVPECTVITGA